MAFDNFEVWDAGKQAKFRETVESIKKDIIKNKDDVNMVMGNTLEALCDALKAVAGTFWYYDVNGDGLIRAFSVKGGADLSNIRLQIGEGIAGKVIKTGVPEKIYDVQNDRNWTSKVDKDSGFVTKSMMVIPLTVNNYTFGCIQLINKVDDSFFDEKDFEFIQTITKEVVQVIDEYNMFPELRDHQDAAIIYLCIDNFDDLAAALKPKQLIDALNKFLTMTHRTIKENGGSVDCFDYENVIGYWIDNAIEKDGSIKACQAAKALIAQSNDIRLLVGKDLGVDIDYSIGIAYGPVYKYVLGTNDIKVRTIAGNGVSMAKNIQSKAEVGTIYTNQALFDKARNKFKFLQIVEKKGGLFGKKEPESEPVYILD